MTAVDMDAPGRFVRTAYEPDDWIAVFLKDYSSGRTAQRVGPSTWITSPRFQAWLRFQNTAGHNVYVSVNSVMPGQRTRRRSALKAIRHIFVDADRDAAGTLARIAGARNLPKPSYVLASSAGKAHIFWRTTGFSVECAEALQKHLARELGTDSAATSGSQMTRLAGFMNHKYSPPCLVTIEYDDAEHFWTPQDFPAVPSAKPNGGPPESKGVRTGDVHRRARRYLEALPPAVAGEHGDAQTFRVCCRLVRGFALSDVEAASVISEWNARCRPPWSDRELMDKLARARRYGREPIGGLLETGQGS